MAKSQNVFFKFLSLKIGPNQKYLSQFNLLYLFKCVYILRIIFEKFSMFFNASYEFVTWTGLELTGVDFPGKFEKGPGIPPEVMDVKHGLRVG